MAFYAKAPPRFLRRQVARPRAGFARMHPKLLELIRIAVFITYIYQGIACEAAPEPEGAESPEDPGELRTETRRTEKPRNRELRTGERELRTEN